MNSGQSFGEMGLINNEKRNATIICLENTHLAVIPKEYFNTILLEIEKEKLKTYLLNLF